MAGCFARTDILLSRDRTPEYHMDSPTGAGRNKNSPAQGEFFSTTPNWKRGSRFADREKPVEMPLDTRMVFCILVYIVNLYTKEVLYGDHFFPDFCRVG